MSPHDATLSTTISYATTQSPAASAPWAPDAWSTQARTVPLLLARPNAHPCPEHCPVHDTRAAPGAAHGAQGAPSRKRHGVLIPELQSCEIWHAVRGIWHGPRDFAGGSPLRDFVPSGLPLVLTWPGCVQFPDPRPRRPRHLRLYTTIKSSQVAPANKIPGAQLSTLSLLSKPQLVLLRPPTSGFD